MKKINKIKKEIVFLIQKLPPIKQMEALDFIRWLWGGPGKSEEFTAGEIEKMESLSKKKGGVKFKSWKDAKGYLQNLMK